MKKFILFTLLLLALHPAFSQKINGQWRGFFNSSGDIVAGSDDNTEYVLELEIRGNIVEGLSYSYFQGRKYYVICKLKGTYYPKTKGIKVTETERIKGNTPPDFQDCLQVHYLTYEKEGTRELLTGKWVTAPGQRAGCGEGSTTLTRRTLNKTLSNFNKQSPRQSVAKNKPAPRKKSEVAKTTPKTQGNKNSTPLIAAAPKPTAPPVTNSNPVAKEPVKVEAPTIAKNDGDEIKSDINFEKRKASILKTIELENETFRVDLYDNGEVDGDSISLFYNNKLILSHKRLSEKAITLNLDISNKVAVNELTMYAENLGEIPPNTALMVVTDGDKRYEVRISSDLKNSGTIRFVHKP